MVWSGFADARSMTSIVPFSESGQKQPLALEVHRYVVNTTLHGGQGDFLDEFQGLRRLLALGRRQKHAKPQNHNDGIETFHTVHTFLPSPMLMELMGFCGV